MTRLDENDPDSFEQNLPDDHVILPDVVAEADLVWRPGVGDPQNPNQESKLDQELKDLDDLELLDRTRISPRCGLSGNSRSSQAVARIRAVKAAFKSQLQPQPCQLFGPPRATVSFDEPKSCSKHVVIQEESTGGPSFVPILDQEPQPQPSSNKTDEHSLYLYKKLQNSADALKNLKSCTAALFAEKDETIRKLMSDPEKGKSPFEDSPTASQPKNILDEVVDVLNPLNNDNKFSRSRSAFTRVRGSPRGRPVQRCSDDPATESGELDEGGRRTGPRRRSPSAGSRSVSPDGGGRARRRDVSRTECLPAPAGGFRRLADMTSNAFLHTPSNAGQAGNDDQAGGKEDDACKGDTMKLKYPLVSAASRGERLGNDRSSWPPPCPSVHPRRASPRQV
jgi:hypothetical protein